MFGLYRVPKLPPRNISYSSLVNPVRHLERTNIIVCGRHVCSGIKLDDVIMKFIAKASTVFLAFALSYIKSKSPRDGIALSKCALMISIDGSNSMRSFSMYTEMGK